MVKKTAGLFLTLLLIFTSMPAGAITSDALNSLIESWRSAWERKDHGTFMAFYSEGFESHPDGHRGLWEKKEHLFSIAGAIRIEIKDLAVRVDGNQAVATFKQTYHSPILSDYGEKKLSLERTGSSWKIYREEWKALAEPARSSAGDRVSEKELSEILAAVDYESDAHLPPLAPVAGEGPPRGRDLDSRLFHAAKLGDLQAVLALLDQGADFEALDREGGTPLHWAAFWGNADVVGLLLDLGADVDARDKTRSSTPLHRAVQGARDRDVIGSLVQKGSRINARDRLGRTPLHLADADTARYLLDQGADKSATDHQGRTPLHMAAVTGRSEAVEVFVLRGAAPHLRDNFGLRASDFAAINGDRETVKFLAKYPEDTGKTARIPPRASRQRVGPFEVHSAP